MHSLNVNAEMKNAKNNDTITKECITIVPTYKISSVQRTFEIWGDVT